MAGSTRVLPQLPPFAVLAAEGLPGMAAAREGLSPPPTTHPESTSAFTGWEGVQDTGVPTALALS